MMARWPRCTPSKLPRVSTTRGSGAVRRGRWRITRIDQPISQRRGREKASRARSAVELGETLSCPAGFVRVRVVLDELAEREPGVGRVAHVDEEVPLLPERGGRLAPARVLPDEVVE